MPSNQWICLYRLCAVCSGYLEFLGCILWWVELPSGHCFPVCFPPLSSTFAIILKVTHIGLIDSLRWNSVSLIFDSVASPHLGRLDECVCCIFPGKVHHATLLTSLIVLQKLKHIRKLVLERKLLTIHHLLICSWYLVNSTLENP